MLRILIVDDDESVLRLLEEILLSESHDVRKCGDGHQALKLLKSELFDLVLMDITMPGMNGIEALKQMKSCDIGADIVMMTGNPEVGTAVEALKIGASDYLSKPLNRDELIHLVHQIAERRFLRHEVGELRDRLGEKLRIKEFIGSSPAMQRLKELIQRVAITDSAVLIEGESGTGKELAAASIHGQSNRRNAPLIPVNCAAIPAELMESEFFGHVRGAFSGASAEARGLFRSADGGTLFLDEISELPLGLQPKLLRVLQDKEVRPVGGTAAHRVDVRIIAATNRNLEQAAKSGQFRQDLFYRLNVVRLEMPPLRERKEDIPGLVMHFLRQFNHQFGRKVQKVSPEALETMSHYDFPGNVRELGNMIERAYALGAPGDTTLTGLSDWIPAPGHMTSVHVSAGLSLDDLQRELISKALHTCANNKEDAARILGMSTRTLYRRLKQLNLG